MLIRVFSLVTLAANCVLAQFPENLTVEGIPPISPELRQDVGRYLEFRTAGFQAWHPTKREMLITTRFGDTSQLHHVATPGGARRQITFLSEPVRGGSFQPKTAGCIGFAQDTGGGEFYQLYRLDPDGRITLLTDGKSRNIGARWARSGKQIAYSSTRRNGRDTDIWVMDPYAPDQAKLVMEVEGGGWGVLDWSHDEKKLLIGRYVSVNESSLHLLDLATGAHEQITPKSDEKVVWAGGEFTADDRTIYTVTDKGSEFQRLARFDLEKRQEEILTPDISWDVEDFKLSPDGKRLAFTVNEQGAMILHILNTETAEVSKPKVPFGVISGLEWHNNSRDLGFSLNAAKSPTDAWSVDAMTGELTRWTQSETGGLDPEQFVEPELVQIKSFDGLAMSGFLYRPDPKKFPGKRPCLVSIHGGPEGQSRPTFQGRGNYYINELGIAVFYPNVRGSAGFGKTFVALDNALKREDSVRDIGAFLDHLRQDEKLDADRFAVIGGSYGGYMVLASMIHHGERLRCGIDIVGISNFLTFLKNTQDYRRDLRRVEYGDERIPEVAEHLAKISPTARAQEIKKPLFIVQGKNDPRVPATEARQMRDAVRDAGGAVWYLEAADEGHGFAKKKNADFMFLSVVKFLQEHLLN